MVDSTCWLRPLYLFAWLSLLSWGVAQEADFAKHYQTIQERLKKEPERVQNEAAMKPPMIAAAQSDLADDEPVLGISLGQESRAYPLTMLFGGGGIFELLNDHCAGQPIAASW